MFCLSVHCSCSPLFTNWNIPCTLLELLITPKPVYMYSVMFCQEYYAQYVLATGNVKMKHI